MDNVEMDSYINMLSDDAKILRPIKNEDSCRELQADILTLYEWSQKWQMNINVDKYLGVTTKSKMRQEDQVNENKNNK